jgi:hypothetical protein
MTLGQLAPSYRQGDKTPFALALRSSIRLCVFLFCLNGNKDNEAYYSFDNCCPFRTN